MDRLGGLVVIAPARRAGDPGSNPGPGEKFSLKLLIYIYIYLYIYICMYMCVCVCGSKCANKAKPVKAHGVTNLLI